MSNSETATWIDGYGNVHAVVPIPSKFGRLSEDELRKARRRAIYAIRRELSVRGWLGKGYRVRVDMAHPASCALSIEFEEMVGGR